MVITGPQIRAARAYMDWTIAQLATASGVGVSTLQKIERAPSEPLITGGPVHTLNLRAQLRVDALAKIKSALENAGFTFPKNGLLYLSNDHRSR